MVRGGVMDREVVSVEPFWRMQVTQHYVHGYSGREAQRLQNQARMLTGLLHSDTGYPDGASVLEAGCGIGAQTVTLASKSPGARITSVDISEASLAAARAAVEAAGLANVTISQTDIFGLPFAPQSFDHVFVCFVLEHLARPADALDALRGVLKPGGSITVIEGDHGSACFHPESAHARRAIECLVALQAGAGGDAMIGRRLYPLLRMGGFEDVQVSPRMVYADASRPEIVEGFTRLTFTAMVEAVRQPALDVGLIAAAEFDRGVADLYRTAEEDGVFCYTFFKARAVNPLRGAAG